LCIRFINFSVDGLVKWKNVYFSANVVQWMLTPNNRQWYYQELFMLASKFSYVLRTVNFTHTRRLVNHMADKLAKQGVSRIY
jgi:ribonuclease HI